MTGEAGLGSGGEGVGVRRRAASRRGGSASRAALAALVLATSLAASPGAAQAASVAAGPLTTRAAPAAVADTSPLSVTQAVRAALGTSPAVAAARARAEQASATVGEARSALLPTLATSGTAMRFQKPMVVAPLHGFNLQNPPTFERTLLQGGLSLSWTLWDGQRLARVSQAKAQAGAATAGADAARAALIARAARAYVGLGAARRVLVAAAARMRALVAERERARRMLKQGKSAPVDVLRAEAALARARADSVSAAGDADVALRSLARLMGVAPAALEGRALGAVRADSMVPSDRAGLLAAATSHSPELARARRQLAAARAGRWEARAAWLPRLQAVGRYTEYGSSPGSFEGEWQGGLELSYPLFAGGSRLSAQDAAAAGLRAAQAEVAGARQQLGDALDRALATLSAANQRVAALAAAVRQSRDVARIEKLSLDAGAGTQTDYLTAQAQLFEARAALTEARAAAVGARVELARVTGELSMAWIEKNLESGS